MIKKIVLKIGKKEISLTPEEFDELRQDILNMKPVYPSYPYTWPYVQTSCTGEVGTVSTTDSALVFAS